MVLWWNFRPAFEYIASFHYSSTVTRIRLPYVMIVPPARSEGVLFQAREINVREFYARSKLATLEAQASI